MTRTGPSLPHLDTNLTASQRASALLSQMTLSQKASQLVDDSVGIPELAVPAYSWWNEALHGVASAGLATVFPQAIGLAASFDVDLVHDVADAIGREARAKHEIANRSGEGGKPFNGLTFYSPNINIFRDPRWGRGQETYGEDPHLTARMGVAFITGMQGDDPDNLLTGATAKHFAVHSGPERGRHAFDATATAHDIEDTYLPAFRAAVTEAKVVAVMAAYNRVNGVPACAHDFLLRERLKQDWGFDGQIVSDCDGVRHIFEQHRWADSMAEAYAVSVKAGMTSVLDFIHGKNFSPLIDAVAQGLLTEADLDEALRPNLEIRFRLGMFDPHGASPYHGLPPETVDSPEHRGLAEQAARKSLVLLKNDGVLPLGAVLRIAVIGPLADSQRVLLGSYHGTPSAVTTVLQGIRAEFPEAEVRFEPGTSFLLDPAPVPSALLSRNGGGAGVDVSWFGGGDFDGEVLHQAVRSHPTYDGLAATRPADVPPNAPVRWSGVLTPAETGDYDLGVSGNSNRLFLDGELMVDDAGPHAPRNTLARVHLEAGRPYSFVMETLPGLEQHAQLIWLLVRHDALERATAAAEWADVVIAVVGLTAELENEEIKTDVPGFEGGDRLSLDLPVDEEAVLKAVKATGRPLTVVLMSGGPVSPIWASENADAILQAWYPGEEGGAAVAQALSGAFNPAGRLPVTLYRGVEDLPGFEDYAMAGRTYRYFEGAPLYPFGFGLSYTRFEYAALSVATAEIQAGAELRLSVEVRNTGERDGEEVVQLYLKFPTSLDGAPRHALRAFRRIALAAGEARRIEFVLSDRDLSHVDPEGERRVGPGAHAIFIGGGQPDQNGVTGSVVIVGERALPK